MSPRWRKVLGDLREDRARTLLVWLAIFIGSTAVTTSLGAHAVLRREVAASNDGSNPAAATLWLDRVDAGLAQAARSRPGVLDAAARRTVVARAEVAPGDWRSLLLFVVEDFADLRVSTFVPDSGAWPARDGELLIERSALTVLGTGVGRSLRVRTEGGVTTALPVVGVVHDAGLAPGWMDGLGYAYATRATLARLGQGAHLTGLRITTAGRDRSHAARIAGALAEWLRAQGHRVQRVEVSPRRHVHEDQMAAMLGLLQVFSLLALGLSATLAAMVMAALMAKQVRQVGILKALGASTGQITRLYVSLVVLIAAAAVAPAMPVGALLGEQFVRFAAAQLNLQVASTAMPGWSLGLAALLGLGVPILGAAIPARRAARLPVVAALAHDGARGAVRKGRMHGGAPADSPLGRTLALALRSTLRHPRRLALTLSALALGGAVLMSAVNVYRSLVLALDRAQDARGTDLELHLLSPLSAEKLEAVARGIPGVRVAEAWGFALASLELPGAPGLGTERHAVMAPPPATRTFRLPLSAGRWPAPDEVDAIVINGALRSAERSLSLRLGTQTALLHGGRRFPVRIVGLVEEIGEPAAYGSPRLLERLTGRSDAAGALRVLTAPHAQDAVALALEERLREAGGFPRFLMTRATVHKSMTDHFLILLACLSGAAMSAVLVGGLGLATSMSLSVLERAREIGVLRALGASAQTVVRLLLLEGSAVAALSVVAAILLSLPISAAVTALLGRVGLQVTMPLCIDPWAIGGWVLLASLLSAAACYIPARSALRIAVVSALAHE